MSDGDVIGLAVAAGAVCLLLWVTLRVRMRRRIRERLFGAEQAVSHPRPRLRVRLRLPPSAVSVAIGVGAALTVYYVVGWGIAFAVAFGFLFGIACLLLLSFFVGVRIVRLQAQLADAIDLMVASLQAGAGLVDAIRSAQQETRSPLRQRIERLLVRIQVGEDPVDVCRDLGASTRIESFRLFYSTLAVQWQSGGSVAPVLSDVGHFVRDHLETLRRVRGQMAEVRLSVLGVLALTYVLGYVIWRAHPERMEGFLSLSLGRTLVAGALALQALGAYWIYRMSKIRY